MNELKKVHQKRGQQNTLKYYNKLLSCDPLKVLTFGALSGPALPCRKNIAPQIRVKENIIQAFKSKITVVIQVYLSLCQI